MSLLGPHLTVANHVELLDAATHKSKRDVEQLIARLRPQPDVPAVIRKLPAAEAVAVPGSEFPVPKTPRVDEPAEFILASATPAPFAVHPPEIKPLAPEYEAEQWSGDSWPSRVRENPAHFGR